MPTYTMKCQTCSHEWDEINRPLKARNAPLPCPECGRMALRKGIEGMGGLHFGPGFFNTGGY